MEKSTLREQPEPHNWPGFRFAASIINFIKTSQTAAQTGPSWSKVSLAGKLYLFFKSHSLLLFSLFTLGLVVVYINPFNATAISDDWAYILTSRHLYDTGQYKLHDWSSANIIFQAYWGTLFAWIGGFSIGTLHISTLTLLVAGIFALYLLAQEHGLNRKIAGFLCFCLVANPLVIYLMLTFMTDVPSLALLIIGLLFYTRGLKRQSLPYMLLAGLATLAAIWTRPTAFTLVAGLGLIFLLDKDRLVRLKLYAAGSIFPFLGGLFLAFGGTSNTFNNGAPNTSGQMHYLTSPEILLPNIFLWRPGIFLIYLGFFSLPLTVGVAIGLLRGRNNRLMLNPKVVAGLSALMVGTLCYNILALKGDWTLPYIGFNLLALTVVPLLGGLATILAIPGGVIIGAVTWERLFNRSGWKALPLEQRFLDMVTLGMLLCHLLFFNLGERYLFVLLPFTYIILGRFLQPRLDGLLPTMIASGLFVIILSAMITRFYQAEQVAEWEGGEYALSVGAEPLKVFNTWSWYCNYNFYDYVKQNPNPADYDYMFKVWLPQREREATYQVTIYPDPLLERGWQIIKTFHYNDAFFHEQSVFVIKRN